MLQLACFDFDGTLFSTEHIHRASIYTVLKNEYAILLSEEESASYSGIPYIDRIRMALQLRNLYQEDKAWELERQAREITARQCEDAAALLTPGVTTLLEDFKQHNIPMGIVSSGKRTIIEHDLKNAGIAQYFHHIIAIEDVQNIKPNPEPYLQALEYFDVNANNAVAFEDSPHGVHSAVSAGIPTIGILTSAHADELVGAKKTVRNFTELSVDQLL